MLQVSIAIAVISILLASPSSAQQAPNAGNPASQQGNSYTLPPGPILGGMGTTNYIPIWASPNFLTDSVMYQTNGNVGIGTTTPAATLDVNGNVNSATTYGIAGNAVVGVGSAADWNLFVGVGAGSSNVPAHGIENSFIGTGAGYSNSTGWRNTFSGSFAGYNTTTGSWNVFSGPYAGYSNTTGENNAFYGTLAGQNNTGGAQNTFVGATAGYLNTIGCCNTFSGYAAGNSNTSGWGNTSYGWQAGFSNTTGEWNTFLGYDTGVYNTTGSSNVYISNLGPHPGTESNVIRIGTQGGGLGNQNVTYIAGINGSVVDRNGVPVYVDDNGQLGTVVSSVRFKEQVHDMGDSSAALLQLRPVTFFYKPDFANGDRTLQYGLIAEEVAKVYPDLVAYDRDGQPYSVRYQYLSTMLLNEVQKEYRRAEEQAEVIATQQAQIKAQEREIEDLKHQLLLKNASLEYRLSRLETQLAGQDRIAQK